MYLHLNLSCTLHQPGRRNTRQKTCIGWPDN